MRGVSCPLVAACCAVSCGAEPWPGQLTASWPFGRWSSSCCGPPQWPGPESCSFLPPGKQQQTFQWTDHEKKIHSNAKLLALFWDTQQMLSKMSEWSAEMHVEGGDISPCSPYVCWTFCQSLRALILGTVSSGSTHCWAGVPCLTGWSALCDGTWTAAAAPSLYSWI